jgi:hypothetical protein
MMLQIPVPPVPPAPPVFDGTVMIGHNDGPPVIVFLAFFAVLAIVLWPLVRALARRIEGRTAATGFEPELEELRGRLQELEISQSRMAELEERLDFTERLLAQQAESARAAIPEKGQAR